MHRLALVLVAASCGRLGFDERAPRDDAPRADGAGDAPPVMPVTLIGSASQAGDGSALSIAIPEVTPGNLLVIAVTTWDGTPVAAVTDAAGTALSSAGARAEMASTSSELWYASPAEATDSIAVAMAGSSQGFDVWVSEFANTATGPPAQVASGCVEYPPDPASEAVATTAANELVIAVEMFAYPVYVDSVEPPFTALGDYLNGNGAAYAIAVNPGAYAPSWSIGSGAGSAAMTCASTAAWPAR